MRSAPMVTVDYMDQPAGEVEHAETAMHSRGISYKEDIPQPMFERWDFLFCENIPDDLPPWIRVSDELPKAYREPGWGRSAEGIAKNGIGDVGEQD